MVDSMGERILSGRKYADICENTASITIGARMLVSNSPSCLPEECLTRRANAPGSTSLGSNPDSNISSRAAMYS